MGADNINIGPCNVYFKGVDLGLTKGGVNFEAATDVHETTVDQFGETPVFATINKRTCKVTVPMVETTLDNLILTMPAATMVIDATDPTIRRVDVKSGIGESLLDFAGPLVLHPTSETDAGKDLTIPLAYTPGAITFAYEANEERIFNVEFMGFVNTDTASADLGLLFSLGDGAATP